MIEIEFEEIKRIEFELLQDFSKFCELHDFKYSLAYGTLLGAIRHKGFIPWDDDIDVIMPRQDYEKFITSYTHANNKVMTHKNTKDYYYPFAKLVDTNTLLVEYTTKKKFQLGIYIDIFPVDVLLDDINQDKEIINNINAEKHKLHLRTIGYTKSRNILRTACKYCSNFFYSFSNYKKYTNRIEDLAIANKDAITSVMGMVVWGDGYSELFDKCIFDKFVDVEFEGHIFKSPAAYEKMLTALYGDYMQLPPIDQQVSNHDFKAFRLN